MNRGQWHETTTDFNMTDREGVRAIEFVAQLLEAERETVQAEYAEAQLTMRQYCDALGLLAVLLGGYYTME